MASAATFRAQLDKLERQQRLARLRSSKTQPSEYSNEHTAERVPTNDATPLPDDVTDRSNHEESSTCSAREFHPRVGMRAVVGDASTRQRFLHHHRPDSHATLVASNHLTLREYLRDMSGDLLPGIHSVAPSVERPTRGTGYLTNEGTARRNRPSTASAVLSPGPAAQKRLDAPGIIAEQDFGATQRSAPGAAPMPVSMVSTRPASAMLQRTRGRLDELLREESLRLQQQCLQKEESPAFTQALCVVRATSLDRCMADNNAQRDVFDSAAPDSANGDIFVQEVSADDDRVDPSLLDDGSTRWTVLSRPTSAITRKPPMILRRAPTPNNSTVEYSLRYRPPSASPAASVSRESEASTPVSTSEPDPLPAMSVSDAAASAANDGASAFLPAATVAERPVSASLYATKFREKLLGLQSATSTVQRVSSRALLHSASEDRQAESATCLTPASTDSSLPSSRPTSVPKRVEFSLDDTTPATASVEVPSEVECFVSSHFFSLKALNEELWRLQTVLDR